MTVPVLLLDIDGVVNALSKEQSAEVWPEAWWLSFDATADGETFPMLISKAVVGFINMLHRTGLVEVRWHTTWQKSAKAVGAEAGFLDFDVESAPEFSDYRSFQKQAIIDGRPTWWKLPAAQRVVVDERRPLIWVDDDLYHEYLRRDDADEKLGGDQPTLLIRTNHAHGLTLTELEKIRVFAIEVKG